MLNKLQIKNYALIESLDIDFTHGFSVITGETGAGKSIILGALGLLMGQRADAKAIKTGRTKCYIEATFDVTDLNLNGFFSQHDIDFDGHELIVRREVNASGKSRAFVNDSPVAVNTLKSLSGFIIDIHSQHQNLLLGHEHFLLDMLDSVADNANCRNAYKHAFSLWQQAVKALDDFKRQCAANQSTRELYSFQLNKLDEANLREGEQEELEQESDVLGHAEDIKSAIFDAGNAFGEDGGKILDNLRHAVQTLQGISRVYPPADELAQRAESARIELEDIASELDRDSEHIEFDPTRQAFVDERLALIYDLEKRHHVETITELLAIRKHLRQVLDEAENSEELITKKENEIVRLRKTLDDAGHALTTTRQKAADATAKDLAEALVFMAMPNVRLHFELRQRPVPDATGFDNVTFLFSANKNIPEQDVAQIASGGETARLMLALKAYISRRRNLPTIIFDEIDTGVSGTVAEKMAKVMQQMANYCQVICITHLPQIAALGTQHFRVFKTETDDSTTSNIVRLTPDERIHEVANMLSGAKITEAAINNAKALLNIKD